MARLTVCYAASSYQSHGRAAAAYRELIGEQCNLVPIERGAEADVVVLHFQPSQYEEIYHAYPVLSRKYVVAYAVWEASCLPDDYPRACSLVQEIWTCSRFCETAFSRHHPRVHYLPHLVERDLSCRVEDDARVRRLLDWRESNVYYLAIGRLWDKRKNLHGLIRAFHRVASRMPHARLILKVAPDDRAAIEPGIAGDPRIVWLAEDLADTEINALYRLARAFVSPHHGEGWGLGLSDAMLFGKPVIATGYSGNLEFMREENSYLVGYTEEPIRREDRYLRFTGDMMWAYPDERALGDALLRLYDTIGDDADAVAATVRQASADIVRFNRDALRSHVTERLASVRAQARVAAP